MMAGVISTTIRGVMSLIQGLTKNENYPDGWWIVQDLIPALSAVVRRLGNLEEKLNENNSRDWWVLVLTSGFAVMVSVIICWLFKKMGSTRNSVDSVGAGVLSLGTKRNMQPAVEFPPTKFR